MTAEEINALGEALRSLATPSDKVLTVSFTHIARHHELDGPGFGASIGNGKHVGSSHALRLADALSMARADLKRRMAENPPGNPRGRPKKSEPEPNVRPKPKPRPKPVTEQPA